MKERYIDLMEKALSAYSDEHILRYYDEVKANGLKEHGFPRLTANIGILIAHGRRTDLMPIFLKMMDLCCKMFLRPYVHAANEFSVREIVCCVQELEEARALEQDLLDHWKEELAKIIPEECYNNIVKKESDKITNWAIFGAVSEYAKYAYGICDNRDFVDRQLSCQFQWLDENGMYQDNEAENIHQPIVYDLVPRGLFAMLLHFGYRGKYYNRIDDCLRKTALLSLKMQSTNGEIAFGGRSIQFLHNEPWLAVILEYEAKRYAKAGNMALAKQFKAAIHRAISVTEKWLSEKPIRHIKNRFPTETKYGCEKYAYFDKYMITTASFLYAAYLLCDDSIPTEPAADHATEVFQPSEHFHKVFLKSGGYMAEIDTNGDPHYDASGLGRVHREGAPGTICMSLPCPSHPRFAVDLEAPVALSLCSAIPAADGWHFAASEGSYEVLKAEAVDNIAEASLLWHFKEGSSIKERYEVSKSGVKIHTEGDGEIGFVLPAFCFDGQISPEISICEQALTVAYEGWICRYTTNGTIQDLGITGANRNGHYRAFLATASNTLTVKIEIEKK